MIKTITPIDNTIYVEREYNSKIIEKTISNSVIAQNEWGSLKVEERVDLLKKFVADFHAFYSLDGLARSYISYNDLMNYWYNEFEKDIIFDVKYEKLLDNPEEKVRGLLSYLDLEYEDKCLEFYKNERFVKTASSVQVRKKLYNTSVERWKNYEKQLNPLYEELKKDFFFGTSTVLISTNSHPFLVSSFKIFSSISAI